MFITQSDLLFIVLYIIWPVVFIGVITVFLLNIILYSTRRYVHEVLYKRNKNIRYDNGIVYTTVGFFHPYCNAGGGGERVLWTAVSALNERHPNVRCVIYTGDTEVSGDAILRLARDRLKITVDASRVKFVFLSKRRWVTAENWPHFTMAGQSLGSIILGWEALSSFVPDIYIDSMGYAFTGFLFKYLACCPTACYVHYPTISTDMIERVQQQTDTYNNRASISRSLLLSSFKFIYYNLFAQLYGVAGRCFDVVMVNSTWTCNHILAIWKQPSKTHIVYPPCDISEFSALKQSSTKIREPVVLSVGQFRPEKDHELQLRSFSKFLQQCEPRDKYTLVLVGGCRDKQDEERVSLLRSLAEQLDITDHVIFSINASFDLLKQQMANATIGLHTMWNEHFGIGIVECMAAGLIMLAHKSGGPLMDIVVPYKEDRPTGFLANSPESYASQMKMIFSLSELELSDIRTAAGHHIEKFSDKNFSDRFSNLTEQLGPLFEKHRKL